MTYKSKQQPHFNPRRSFLKPQLWIRTYFKQKEIKYIPAGGHSLIWHIRVFAAEQGMVFKVLSLKKGIQFHY